MNRKLISTKAISTDAGVLLLRLFSLFFMYYGWDKLANFQEKVEYWPDPFHIGKAASLSLTIFGEFVCPFFIVLGLFTRIFLTPAIITMLVAILHAHAGQSLLEREHALSFLVVFLAIFLTGPGKFSVDALLKKS
jgi:putative oxidoreductase